MEDQSTRVYHVFSPRGGSAGVQALRMPRRWLQSSKHFAVSSTGGLSLGRISSRVWKPEASGTANLIKSEPLGASLAGRLNQSNLSCNPFSIWRMKVTARGLCV